MHTMHISKRALCIKYSTVTIHFESGRSLCGSTGSKGDKRDISEVFQLGPINIFFNSILWGHLWDHFDTLILL